MIFCVHHLSLKSLNFIFTTGNGDDKVNNFNKYKMMQPIVNYDTVTADAYW